jgi:hypothetical protein
MNGKNIATTLLIVFVLASCTTVPSLTNTPLKPTKTVAECPFKSPVLTQQTPSDLYGKIGLANAEWKDENFTFTFWLYCDPTLQSASENDKYSAIPALGLLAKWKYTGKQIGGHNADFWGFENDIKSSTAWDGPLYRANSGFNSGIYLSQEIVANKIQTHSPFSFTIGLDSPLGKNGAVFSFTLKQDGNIYIISTITAKKFRS